MSGVTLMFALWPPLGPTAIPMVVLLYCPGAAGAGGAFGAVFLCSVSKPRSSTPAARTAIHDLHHAAKTGPHVRFHVHALVLLVGQAIFHLGGQVVDLNLFRYRNTPCRLA